MGLTIGQARAIGANKGAVRSALNNRDEWMEHAHKLESQLGQLKRDYQRLSDKHVRISGRYEWLETMGGYVGEKPSVKAIGPIHVIKAQQLTWKARDEGWDTQRIREENIRLMAEAEYDYHVLADPIYRLHNASETLLKMADNAEDEHQSEKINALVMKMKQTGGAREDDHREKFLNDRVEKLTESIRYEDDYSVEPIIDSIPSAEKFEKTTEQGQEWKFISADDDVKELLINR